MVSRPITAALILLVVLAGCAGNGTDGGATTTATEETTTAETTATTTTSEDGDAGDGSGDGTATEWEPYDFREGEYYEFEFHEQGSQVGTLAWEVVSVSDDGETVTVHTTGTFEGQSFETTVTGSPETVYTNMLGTPAAPYLMVALYSPFVTPFYGEQLAIGQGWSYTDSEGTKSYRVERTDRIADRDVFVIVLRENDVPVWEAWVDPELGFAAKSVIYDEGEVDVEVRLVEYRR